MSILEISQLVLNLTQAILFIVIILLIRREAKTQEKETIRRLQENEQLSKKR